ncbi:MAG: aspartate aminotransferase [Planctomycetota bacterium]|nr:MAG: aspartate aminotransferase [Planctomycetota bacterium]
MKISSTLALISESTTLAITARAAKLRSEGRDVISLSAGEPDFQTPEIPSQGGIRAIKTGKTKYTAAAGLPLLRAAVARSLARDFGMKYSREEICITAGTKPAIHLSLLSLLEKGDRVIVMAPYWVSYPDLVRLAGGVPLLLQGHEEDDFLPDEAEIAKLFEEGASGIILNSPCNPTGTVWPRERIASLVQLCEKHDAWILSDEIYGQILYDDAEHVSPAQLPGGRERTVVLNGFSKSFSMTGWRIGYLAAPENLTQSVIRAQSQMIGNPCTPSQHAALAALSEDSQASRLEMVEAFAERRAYMLDAIPKLPGFTLRAPEGAFYLFPGVQGALQKLGIDDVEFAKRLLDEALLAVVPGSAFGLPGHLRVSFASSIDDLQHAVERIESFLSAAGVSV